MSKITRKAFKRKKIVTGIALFGAVGLISTGFAAWVLSSSVTVGKEVTLHVGAVDDKNMTIDFTGMYDTLTLDSNRFLKYDDQNHLLSQEATGFSFDSDRNDNSGRVRRSEDEYEIMSLTVFGTIGNAEYLSTVKAQLDGAVNDGFKVAAGTTSRHDDVNDADYTVHYITLPACFAAAVEVEYLNEDFDAVTTLENAKYTNGQNVTCVNFRYTIAFGWGADFNNINPSKYYDEDAAGALVAKDVVKETLTDLHDILYSITDITINFTADPTV